MSGVHIRVPAKINLHLGVGAAREDGFHPLATVYHAIGIHDDLIATPASRWRLETVTAAGIDPADVPAGKDNLVTRAARLLHAHLPGLHVRIEKAIPIAGGLAGGSADAAAALLALDLLAPGCPPRDLSLLAAELGSDIPFALVGGTAIGTGRGEVVAPVPDPHTWWWTVVPAAVGLSTPEVYRHFDRLHPDAPAVPAPADRVLAALATGDPRTLAAALHNDLQTAAVDLRPELATLLARGEAEGALRGLVSGSGPTCVFLCESRDAAVAVADAIGGSGPARVLVAAGPARGAHQVVGAP